MSTFSEIRHVAEAAELAEFDEAGREELIRGSLFSKAEVGFYRGEWTEVPDENDDKAYAYFSVPAGLVNMLAKIKDVPQYTRSIGGFEKATTK